MMGRKRIGAAFLAAFVLHAGALAALTIWSSRHIQSPPGEQEITIDLAPAMAFEEILNPAEAIPVAEPPPEVTEIQPPEPISGPVEEATPPPEEVAETNPPEEPPPVEEKPVEPAPPPEPQVVEALPPPEEVVEPKPAPEPAKPPVQPKTESKDPPKPRKLTPKQNVASSALRQQQAASSRENNGGAAASADPNVINRYAAQLAAALRNRLRYPDIARRQGVSGVATIRFTMQHSGRIISASLVRGTGNDILDQAALATAAPGTALPSAPDALPQQQLTFTVPLRFNIR
jgi:periplasmic protein TonB